MLKPKYNEGDQFVYMNHDISKIELITISSAYTINGSKEIYYDFNLSVRMVPESTLDYWKKHNLYKPINGIKRAVNRQSIKKQKGRSKKRP